MSIKMKRTQITELRRTIRRSLVLFTSMVMVSCLGALCYCGFSFCEEGLLNMGRGFYGGANFYDLTVSCPLGVTDSALDAIRSTAGVRSAEVEYSTQLLFEAGDIRLVGKFYSQPEGINVPDIVSGRSPAGTEECVIEAALSEGYGFELGDTVEVSGDTGALRSRSLTIVGIMESPLVFRIADYNNRGASAIGDGQISSLIWVDVSALDLDAAVSCCYITMDTEYRRFTREYDDSLADLEGDIKALGLRLEGEKYAERKNSVDDEFAMARDAVDACRSLLDRLRDSGSASETADAEKALSDAEGVLTALGKREAMINDRGWAVAASDSNPSYYHFTITCSGMDSILYTCSGLFLCISALVCYTTVSRLVSEQKRLIGTQKALGMSRREITAKYLAYAALSAGIGSAVGIALSYFWFAGLVFRLSYGNSYLVNEYIRVFRLLSSAAIFLLETVCSLLAALGACRRLVGRRTVLLMNSSVNGIAKTPAYERLGVFRRMRLPSRVTLRNIRTDRKLFVTTQVGVIGCTLLLVAFLTVRSCMAEMPVRQYTELQRYDLTVFADSSCTFDERTALENTMADFHDASVLNLSETSASFADGGGTYHYISVLCCREDSLLPFVSLLEPRTGEELSIPREGILLSDLTAREYGYRTGDAFLLCDSYGNTCETFVAGLFERHLGHALAINADYYEALTGETPDFCQYYVKLNGVPAYELRSAVLSEKALVNLTDNSQHILETEGRIKAMDKALLVILALTLALSVFVLFNLEVMHITQKESELMVMKALGFTRRELRRYVVSEIMLMSLLGILIGVPAGTAAGLFISVATQISGTQNVTRIYPMACLIGGAAALAFVCVSICCALRRVRRLSITSVSRE